MLALKIIEIDGEGRIIASDVSHNDATAELGNLKKISGLRAGNKGLFFPVTSHAKMIEVTSLILNGEEPTGKEALKAKSDLNNAGVLGVVSENGIYGHSRFCNTDFDGKRASDVD